MSRSWFMRSLTFLFLVSISCNKNFKMFSQVWFSQIWHKLHCCHVKTVKICQTFRKTNFKTPNQPYMCRWWPIWFIHTTSVYHCKPATPGLLPLLNNMTKSGKDMWTFPWGGTKYKSSKVYLEIQLLSQWSTILQRPSLFNGFGNPAAYQNRNSSFGF